MDHKYEYNEPEYEKNNLDQRMREIETIMINFA